MSAENKARGFFNPDSEEKTSVEFFQLMQDKYPQYKSQFQAAEKVAKKVGELLDKASPVLDKLAAFGGNMLEKAHTMKLDALVPMLIGLALCFFGGYFTMILTVVATVRVTCWDDLKANFAVLKRNYEVAYEQSKKDNNVDANNDGIPDVQQMEKSDLLTHKLTLLVKSMDMNEVTSAAKSIAAAMMAVIAALRVRLARAFTYGVSIADFAKQHVPLEKVLNENLPAQYKKWAPTVARVIFVCVGITIAMLFSRYITMLHCCMRGAELFVSNAVSVASERGLLEEGLTMQSRKAEVLLAIVAGLGFLFQSTHSAGLPFPLNFLFFPLTMAESIVTFVVNGVLFAAPR